MKEVSLNPRLSKYHSDGRLILLFVYCLLIFFSGSVRAQTKILADQATITTPGNGRYKVCIAIPCSFSPTVQNISHATVEDNQYTRMYASPGLVLGLAKYKGGIELTFPQTLAANQWSYVRIGADNSLLRTLLCGS